MVRPGREIWWLEDGAGGERRFVTDSQKDELTSKKGASWRPVEKIRDPVTGEEMTLRQPVVDERDLLTLTQSEAVAFGFAKAIVSSDSDLRTQYHLTGDLGRFTQSWSEEIADFLSSPIIRTILMMLIGLGVYAEFNAPGHFVGGTVAAIALIIFLGAPYITGLADVWEIIVVAAGILLLAAEIFFFPTFGIAALVGIALIFIGLIATFVPAEPGPLVIPRLPGTWLGLRTGIQVVFGGLGLAAVGMWVLNKYLPHLPGANRMLLAPPRPTAAHAGGVGWVPMGAESVVRPGDTGRTLTRLRPAGKASLNGRRIDVIAPGQMIDEDRLVEVIEVAGSRVVVKEIREK
jgi:membrane-bound serine protease (ClpP class)